MAARAVFRAGVIAALVLLAAQATLTQDTSITGARITIIEKKTGGLSVTLENLRDTALVAWELGVVGPGWSEPGVVRTADFTQPWRHGPDSGPVAPVAPGVRRVVNIQLDNIAENSVAVINLAVFADGYYEGRPASVEKFRQRRQEQADDLRYWVGALQQMPRGSNETVRAFLREQLARHASRPGARESNGANNLRSLATEDVQRFAWMARRVDGPSADRNAGASCASRTATDVRP